MPFAVTFSLQYLVGVPLKATQYTWIYDARLPFPPSPMHELRSNAFHRRNLWILPFSILFMLSARKFYRERKFPLFIFSGAQRSTFTNFFFLVGKQIFLWFNVCTCRRNNGDVRDQLLNSVCWFFPRAQVRDEESFLPHSRTYTLCVWKRSRELNLYLYVLHTGSLRSHLRKTKWRNWFSALSSKRKIW